MKSEKDQLNELTHRPIVQIGLTCRSDAQAKEMIDRVNKFNLLNIGNAVYLDVIPFEKGDQWCPDPHYKIRLHFPNKAVQLRFWGL